MSRPATPFEKYMAEVDRQCWAISGMSVYDLEDYPYYDSFEDEEDPHDVAIDALYNAGFPMELLEEQQV